jgi:hypothetical protein
MLSAACSLSPWRTPILHTFIIARLLPRLQTHGRGRLRVVTCNIAALNPLTHAGSPAVTTCCCRTPFARDLSRSWLSPRLLTAPASAVDTSGLYEQVQALTSAFHAWQPRLRSLDHGTHALGIERLTTLVEVPGILQPVADLSEAKTLPGFGACPP